MNQRIVETVSRLGENIKTARINAGITQHELAEMIGKSRTAVEGAEKGKCNLQTYIAILDALNLDDLYRPLLLPQAVSPVQLAKVGKSQRKRASGKRRQNRNDGEMDW